MQRVPTRLRRIRPLTTSRNHRRSPSMTGRRIRMALNRVRLRRMQRRRTVRLPVVGTMEPATRTREATPSRRHPKPGALTRRRSISTTGEPIRRPRPPMTSRPTGANRKRTRKTKPATTRYSATIRRRSSPTTRPRRSTMTGHCSTPTRATTSRFLKTTTGTRRTETTAFSMPTEVTRRPTHEPPNEGQRRVGNVGKLRRTR